MADARPVGREVALRRTLHDYFAWATRCAMSRYHDSPDQVPDHLRLRHWSWEGLVP